MTSLVTERSPEPGIWQAIYSNVWWILTKLPLGEGSCPWLQLRHSINLHKAMSLPFCLLCMYLTDNWSYPACIYTAAHGSYGQVGQWEVLADSLDVSGSLGCSRNICTETPAGRPHVLQDQPSFSSSEWGLPSGSTWCWLCQVRRAE